MKCREKVMLEDIKKYKWSLAFITLLICIKIIIVPIFAWQDEQLSAIGLLKKQYVRIENVLNNRQQIEEYATSLSQSLAAQDKLFLKTVNPATFQLEQQQWLEEKIRVHDLKIDNIGWAPSQVLEENNLVTHNVQLNIDGKTSNVIAFIQRLQAQPNYIAVQAFNISFKSQRELNLGTGRVRLNLIFYRRDKY